jgi:tRNA-dihydrouridine synthase
VQQYGGQADWDEIAILSQAISIPVIGNGDVQTPEDIDRMKAYTGCDAVMIGRAAIGNPWIFGRLKREDLSPVDIIDAAKQHLREMNTYYGDILGVVLFRKHLKQYLAGTLWTETMLPQMLKMTDLEQLQAALSTAGEMVQVSRETSR